MQVRSKAVTERKGLVKDMDRSFDIEFWQAQDTTDRFHATWDMIRYYLNRRGMDEDGFRLQRTVESVQRQRR